MVPSGASLLERGTGKGKGAWALVALGLLIALIMVAKASQRYGSGLVTGFIALLPGLGVAFAGVFSVAWMQIGLAVLDLADLAWAQAEGKDGNRSAQSSRIPSGQSHGGTGKPAIGDRVKAYRGYEIKRHAGGVEVAGQVFPGLMRFAFDMKHFDHRIERETL